MPISSFTAQVMQALGRLKLFATAALPSSAPPGQLVYDTTADAVKVCKNDGVTFAAIGGAGGGVVVGDAVTGGVASTVLYTDAVGNVGSEAAFGYVDTTNTLTADNVTVATILKVADGTAGAPSIRSATAGNGFYFGNGFFAFTGAGVARFIYIAAEGVRLGSDVGLKWTPTSDTAASIGDVGFARAAAGVLKATNGAAGSGWLQQPSGELALNANYTNATAGFTNTALSATVISGRTYTFECCLFFDDSTAVDGAQFDFNGGSAGVTNFRAQAFAYNNVGAALAITNGAVTALATAIQVALALTTQTMIVIKGSFVPSGAGTFIVRAAQTAHTTGTLTVDRGSYLNIRDANPL